MKYHAVVDLVGVSIYDPFG